MANCPKCNAKLKLTDIDQCCPHCGVNMRLFGFEEQFYKEAKTAELSQAGYSCKVRRFKMAMIGSKLTVARLIVMLLPLAALLIPSGSTVISLPFRETAIPISALGLYNAVSGGEFNLINSFAAGMAESDIFSALKLVCILIGITSVIAFLTFLLSLLCFLSIKNMQKVICSVSGLGVLLSVASFIGSLIFVKKAESSVILSATKGIGLIIAALMFLIVFFINLMIDKKGINVVYDEGMVERSEIWKKVVSGEVSIDDLPYPVVETEETKKIKEEIAADREAFRKSHEENKEESNNEEKC